MLAQSGSCVKRASRRKPALWEFKGGTRHRERTACAGRCWWRGERVSRICALANCASGKSSLVFGTLYAEAQRRYLESVAPYARRLFHQMGIPDVDEIDGIPRWWRFRSAREHTTPRPLPDRGSPPWACVDFFSRKDPTHDWPAAGAGPLRFVMRGEMNGIAFDAPFDALRVLGKPSNPRPIETRLFAYAPLGLAVAMGANSEVLVFTCVFQAGAGGEADEFPGFCPAELRCRASAERCWRSRARPPSDCWKRYWGHLRAGTPKRATSPPWWSAASGSASALIA